MACFPGPPGELHKMTSLANQGIPLSWLNGHAQIPFVTSRNRLYTTTVGPRWRNEEDTWIWKKKTIAKSESVSITQQEVQGKYARRTKGEQSLKFIFFQIAKGITFFKKGANFFGPVQVHHLMWRWYGSSPTRSVVPMVHGTEFTTAELKAKFPENYDNIISSGAARCWAYRNIAWSNNREVKSDGTWTIDVQRFGELKECTLTG